jgi:hypothetical protein
MDGQDKLHVNHKNVKKNRKLKNKKTRMEKTIRVTETMCSTETSHRIESIGESE